MGQRKTASRESIRRAASDTPIPHNQVYSPRKPGDDHLSTSLLLAGERLAEPYRDPDAPRSHAPHAQPSEDIEPPVDLSELIDLLARFQSLLERDARLRGLLEQLPAAFDETLARVLLRNVFPELRPSNPRRSDGKPLLSRREREILREAAGDLSHEEIAARFFISPRTVGTHLKNIYDKLGVSKPMHAVARAIALGYLDLDSLDVVEAANRFRIRDLRSFDTLITQTALSLEPKAASFKPFAQLGLLLMTLCGIADGAVSSDRHARSYGRSLVCEVGVSGEIKRSFGEEYLHFASGLAISPPHAARQGFTPDNLFVLNQGLAICDLNRAEIVEFTPEGKLVRAFSGGLEIGTRLTNSCGIAFSADGRLLVTTGVMRDGILAFGNNGATVERFADGCFIGLCVGADGKVYAPLRSGLGSSIHVFDPCGRLLRTVGSTPPDIYIYYHAVGVDSRENIFAARFEAGNVSIEEYDRHGALISTISLPNRCWIEISIDTADRLRALCVRSGDILDLDRDGRIARRWSVCSRLMPRAIVFGPDHRLWAACCVPASS